MHGSYGTYGKECIYQFRYWFKRYSQIAETESMIWAEAHISITQRIDQNRLPVEVIVLYIPVDGVLRIDHRKLRKPIRDKGGIAHWKALMV